MKLADYIKSRKGAVTPRGTSIDYEMALISHYMHNRGTSAEAQYTKGAEAYNTLMCRNISTPITDADAESFMEGITTEYQPVTEPAFTFIDLFAGIGGFRLAMQACGGKCVFSSEFNPNAKKTYSLNYGDVPFGDITLRATKDCIPQDFDVICGGFPCQAFSIAGYQKGFEDTRGTLFFDIAEIIREHRPKAAFLENVRNLEGHDNGKTFAVIRQTLNGLGYEVYHKVINACEYGNIPQTRARIMIVAISRDRVPNYGCFRFPEPIELTRTIHDCIQPGPKDEKYYYRPGHIYYDRLLQGMQSQNTIYQWRRVYVRENKNKLCPTLTANMGGGGHNVPLILTDEGIRKLTPKECLNFMGYPANFAFPGSIAESAKYMQAGNSVVVPMMTRVAGEIVRVLSAKEQ